MTGLTTEILWLFGMILTSNVNVSSADTETGVEAVESREKRISAVGLVYSSVPISCLGVLLFGWLVVWLFCWLVIWFLGWLGGGWIVDF